MASLIASARVLPERDRPGKQPYPDGDHDAADHGPLPLTGHRRSVDHADPLPEEHAPDEAEPDTDRCSSPHELAFPRISTRALRGPVTIHLIRETANVIALVQEDMQGLEPGSSRGAKLEAACL